MKVKLVNSYEFGNRAIIAQETINECHNEILEGLKKRGSGRHSLIQSGNSVVLGLKYDDTIEIFEFTTGYTEHTYIIKKKKRTHKSLDI